MIQQQLFRLPQLAERWGCTVDVLLQAGIAGQLQVCYPVAEITRRSRSTVNSAALPVEEGARMAPLVDHIPAQGYAKIGTGALQAIEGGESAAVSKYIAKVSIGEVWRFEFAPPLVVRREDLCVLQTEVERLDREEFGHVTTMSPAATSTAASVEEKRPAPTPRATRSDLLTVEIQLAIARLSADSDRGFAAVLAELKKVAGAPGSCVISVGVGFVLWRNSRGGESRTEKRALEKRLERLPKKGLSTLR